MPPKKRELFISGRRLENREKRASLLQAAQADHPNETEFGEAEYVDEFRRQYRLAYLNRLGGWEPGKPIPTRPKDARVLQGPHGSVKLWVRLKRNRVADWYTMNHGRERLTLRPVLPGLMPCTVQIVYAFRDRPSRRTGFVNVLFDYA